VKSEKERERESESATGRTGCRMKGKEAEKFAAGDLATRIPQSVNHSRRAFSMHHGENTVTAKSRAPTRKTYIGGERGQRDAIYPSFNPLTYK